MVNSLIFQSAMPGLAERLIVQSNIEANNPDAYYHCNNNARYFYIQMNLRFN